MDLFRLLLILRARYKAALLVAFVVLVAVTAASQLLPKQYTAETTVMVDVRSPDPVTTVLLPPTMIPGNMSTQLEIIGSDLVARKVVRIMKLAESPAVKEMWLEATAGSGKLEDWMSALIQRGLKVSPSRDSNIITISYRGGDPTFVAAVANAYAQAYIEASIELKVEPARQYASWFSEQAKVLRENLESAQARLSEFQQKRGIVVTEEALDYELARLSDLSSRLTAAQGETRDAQSKVRPGGRSGDTLPEVMQDSVVAGLRSNIAQLEAKLKEAAGNLGVKHPQYQRMESELAELKKRLEAETSHVASGYSASSAVGKAREAELRAAIEAQKTKLLDMKRERDEIAVLARDVEIAKRAYEAVTNRLNQTNLESQANRTNVVVLAPALEPLQPTFPKPLAQTLLFAIVVSIVFAGACVFGLEMLDPRVRSADDLAEMLQFPVLAVIRRSERRGRLLLRSPALPLR